MRRGYRTSTDTLAALVGIARVLDEAVVARSAVDLVLAAAERDDEIVVAVGGEHVRPEAAVELVVAGPAVEQVAAAAALQRVPAAPADEQVGAAAAGPVAGNRTIVY
jgi:hypothetical protein